MEELYQEINDLKRDWRSYLVENDRNKQLKENLQNMFNRIQSESSGYQEMLK
jgi:FtsZ-binding cell division protein ZapB